MLKLTVAVLAIVLAGSASAAGWKKLTVDASSEAAFEKSLAEFKEELTPARASVFGQALKDIWVKGSRDAEANQHEYTAADYYRDIHGLGYEEVVTLTDPTGETAEQRYKAAAIRYSARNARGADAVRVPAAHIPGRADERFELRPYEERGRPGNHTTRNWDPSK